MYRNPVFYIPLLTMNMISRDLSGGTIKLLQSAPLRNAEIVLGKYLALMVFGLAMMGVLLFYVLFGVCTIQNIDFPYVLTGMLGLYLLLCAYAAIGLFVSSLTSYQVMAAFGTLFILAMFNYVGGVAGLRVCAGYYLLVVYTGTDGRVYLQVDL